MQSGRGHGKDQECPEAWSPTLSSQGRSPECPPPVGQEHTWCCQEAGTRPDVWEEPDHSCSRFQQISGCSCPGTVSQVPEFPVEMLVQQTPQGMISSWPRWLALSETGSHCYCLKSKDYQSNIKYVMNKTKSRERGELKLKRWMVIKVNWWIKFNDD